MAVGADAHQHEIEQGARGVKLIGTIERFQFARVVLGTCVWIGQFGRDRMDIGGWRALIQENLSGRSHVVQRIACRNEPFVADEPMHTVPRDFASIGFRRKQRVELGWT